MTVTELPVFELPGLDLSAELVVLRLVSLVVEIVAAVLVEFVVAALGLERFCLFEFRI